MMSSSARQAALSCQIDVIETYSFTGSTTNVPRTVKVASAQPNFDIGLNS